VWAIIVTNTKLQKVVYHKYGVLPTVLEDSPLLAGERLDYRRSNRRTSNSNEEHRHYQREQSPVQYTRSISRQLGSTHESSGENFAIAIVSSFASDEPIQEIIEAARILSETTTFYITGDYSRISAKKLLKWKRATKNIVFTGFLDRGEYIRLLEKVDAIMVLTRRDFTMLSGAHEALALEKPLITSDWQPLRQYFVAGTSYVNNSVSEIVDAVKYVQKEKDRMEKDMEILKHQRLKEWEDKVSKLKECFSSRADRGRTFS
jgi:glycosyltransferase involved in cell wall biosynthesis